MEPLDKFYDTIVVHHSGNEVDYPTVKQVQDKHMDSKSDSRADIGYHYAIDKDGKIYEGRDIKFKGSHVNKANTGKIGIVLLADLSTDDAGMGWRSTFEWSNGELTNKLERSLLKLCKFLDDLYGIEILAGHMEINTDRYCPGNLTMAKINNWRKLLKMKKP
ncbi:N-acetylmuramoyl-L-alanine amidase [Apibacter muscae]|uniref:N-acetylmuramoyl-L-alanine amidase n=2 Tax=Apibacter muscae TaxID=2509004 RepID=A0A563DF27_9FLAO|nr:N-acetylmuramoyl-L-alanine amidase [Apibacter muscae]TWP31568.1 N-acetylmuramoyl-L-alanine amidase [Apibacter muscae]